MTYTRLIPLTFFAAVGVTLSACSPNTSTTAPADVSAVQTVVPSERFFTADQFTYANYQEVIVKHAALDLDVDFDRKVLDGAVTLRFERIEAGARTLTLDTKDLVIKDVALETGEGWTLADYTLADADPVLGSAMSIDIGPDATQLRITYETSPNAEGLQWLTPAQTAGKEKPYLFSQAQAINARTMLPIQDTPAVRMTYEASLRVPDGLLPLMSASQDGKDGDGNWTFSMPQPIPSYLIAIAVGDIKFKAINDTIGVYAEDYILDAAAEEFAETPMMEVANTELYGPYRWGRYDLIVLPPSFPFGGMENPRLSFMTPTLIAGDKSLTNVVAHELAHSWSGNLVTNASWRDAWLNEGFTSYVENRVMEDLYGENRAIMEQALGLEDLKRDIAGAERPSLTQLKFTDDLTHPDEAFSQVTYVKGQFFLNFLEDRFGRAAFDPFLKSYFNAYAFDSITTEDFLGFMNANLRNQNPDAVTDAEIQDWVYGQGLPATIRNPQSDAFNKVAAASARWSSGDITAAQLPTADWSTHEWLHFLNGLPDLTQAQYKALDDTFSLTGTQNAETAFAWYMQAIKGGYAPAMPALEEFLMTVGRGKFIYRLYGALNDNGQADIANRVFAKAQAGYHPIAQRRISDILAK
ncbi:M1 family metallopeptidase [Robiginitomaculum antarcticum]|uniref:M1 family metallopeptidase n=1 Tax=Robiginitomaculum antarcticum TaxID=437507 RepID=UPI0003786360|nr:M1 family metallopeptidase [Robiginitomaculum antarcticum]